VWSSRTELTVLSAAALIAFSGIQAVAIDSGQSGGQGATLATDSLRETSTVTTAPSTLPTPRAVPRITGPAPLPLEEQGLPGNN
jgi:hypothetical protein